MDFQHEKTSQTLEMKAKRALTDLSNQEDFRGKQWLEKSRVKIKRNFQGENELKFPEIHSKKYNQKQSLKSSAFQIRCQKQLSKHLISHHLKTQQPKQLPHYNINRKFAQQMSILRDKTLLNHSISSKNKENSSERFYTEPRQSQIQESQIMDFIKAQKTDSEQKIKSSWSLHVKKSLTSMNKIKQNISKEIQEIKELIYDKRIKCRKLSRQGYLIVKRDSIENLHDYYPHCIQSMELKHKTIQKVKSRYDYLPKTNLAIRPNQQETIKSKENSLSSHFLRNALQIFHTKQPIPMIQERSLSRSIPHLNIQS